MEQIGAFLPLILILTILVIYYFYKRNKQKQAGIVEVQEELFGFGKLINIIFVIPFLVIFGLVAHFINSFFSWESTGGADFTLFQTYWLSAALFAIPLCFNLFFYPRTDANKREKYIWLVSLFVFCLVSFNLIKTPCSYFTLPFSIDYLNLSKDSPFNETYSKMSEINLEKEEKYLKKILSDVPNGLEYLECRKNLTLEERINGKRCSDSFPGVIENISEGDEKYITFIRSTYKNHNRLTLYKYYKLTSNYEQLSFFGKSNCDIQNFYTYTIEKKMMPLGIFIILNIIAISIIMYICSRVLYYFEITAISIGSANSEETLRTALAVGADNGILVETEEDIQPLEVAKILKEVIKKNSPDLVLMGKQAIDDDSNQTGQMLSALLGWPQGTFASKLEINGKKINVTREIDGGLETLSMELPAIVTTDLRLNEPRYASLPNIMKAKQKPIEKISPSDLNIEIKQRLKTLKVTEPPKKESGIKIDSVQELISKLHNEEKVI